VPSSDLSSKFASQKFFSSFVCLQLNLTLFLLTDKLSRKNCWMATLYEQSQDVSLHMYLELRVLYLGRVFAKAVSDSVRSSWGLRVAWKWTNEKTIFLTSYTLAGFDPATHM
jgi:hypothetical protein